MKEEKIFLFLTFECEFQTLIEGAYFLQQMRSGIKMKYHPASSESNAIEIYIMKKNIPNFITILNLSGGVFTIYLLSEGEVRMSLIVFGLCLVFDFLDGLSARALKAYSELGKQLDSLADMVSFGVVPAFMVLGIIDVILLRHNIVLNIYSEALVKASSLIIPAFSAIRLARFNLMENSKEFIGLPTPANAIFWAGIFYSMYTKGTLFDQEISLSVTIILVVFMSALMLAPVHLISLKVSSLKIKENAYVYVLLLLSIAGFLAFGLAAAPVVILTYILLSLVKIILT